MPVESMYREQTRTGNYMPVSGDAFAVVVVLVLC